GGLAVGVAVGGGPDVQVGRGDRQAGVRLMDGVVAVLAVGVGKRGADGVAADAGAGRVAGAGEAGGDTVVVQHAAERARVAGSLAVGLAVGVGGDIQVGAVDVQGAGSGTAGEVALRRMGD